MNSLKLNYDFCQGQPYFAALKSDLNKNTESYYLIEGDKVTKQEDGKIYLYK